MECRGLRTRRRGKRCVTPQCLPRYQGRSCAGGRGCLVQTSQLGLALRFWFQVRWRDVACSCSRSTNGVVSVTSDQLRSCDYSGTGRVTQWPGPVWWRNGSRVGAPLPANENRTFLYGTLSHKGDRYQNWEKPSGKLLTIWRPETEHHSCGHSREQGRALHENLYDTLRCLISSGSRTDFPGPTRDKARVSGTRGSFVGSPQTPCGQSWQQVGWS